jgi:hypothetical protein
MTNQDYILSTTTDLVKKDFSLEFRENPISEEQLLHWLSDYIAEMLEYKLEALFSILYLMDVNEDAVHATLAPTATDPANVAIAQLVIDRLRRKAETRLAYRQAPPTEDDEDAPDW